MEREFQKQYERLWASFKQAEKRTEQTEASFNRRMDRAEKRMDRAEKRMEQFDRRMELVEKRGELADKRIEATRKLVEAGMKILIRDRAEIRALGKRMDAYLRSAGNGRNGGNGHGPERGR